LTVEAACRIDGRDQDRKETKMNKSGRNKRLAAGLAFVISLMTFSTGYSYYQGLGEIVHNSETYLTEDVFYDEQISVNSSQAVEHAYSVDIQETEGSVMPYVFVGDVTGRCSMTYMQGLIKEEGYQIVTAVNGDFFDTVTGVPLGMSIHEGKIKNSGLNYSNAVGFRQDGTAFMAPIRFDYFFSVNDSAIYNFNHVNKPRGASNGMHYYNSQYGASTKTSVNCTEVVLTAEDSTELSIDGTLNAVVDEIRPETMDTPIGDDQIILSAAVGTSQAAILATLLPGDSVSFGVTDQTGVWSDAVEAIGAYQIIAQNGYVTTTDQISNPRTCLGIKEDGSVILFAVDGRQSGHSVGMNLTDAANYLIERGCVSVVNFDGGGSTMMLARMPGDTDAKIVNKPSDGKERSVSNALVFVLRDTGSGDMENLHLYPLSSVMMPGASVQMSVKATDDLYCPVSDPDDVSFETHNGLGYIDNDGWYTAGEDDGEDEITAEAEGMRASVPIRITSAITMYPDQTDIVIDPGKTTDINIKAFSRYVPVIAEDDLFTWTCDEKIGSIDQDGVFTSSDRTGVSGKIYITYNGKEKTIPVQVGPTTVSFDDTNGHWAQKFIEILAAKQIVKGMGDDIFLPDAQLTRAQFLTMLSNTVYDLDVSQAPAASFTDVDPIEWYAPYINWGSANKIVNGNLDGTFAPNAPITREQMAVILNNFAAAEGFEYVPLNGEVTFTDSAIISPWASQAVGKIVRAGVMNGRPEGNYDPQGFATRAEASKVIYSVVNLMD